MKISEFEEKKMSEDIAKEIIIMIWMIHKHSKYQ